MSEFSICAAPSDIACFLTSLEGMEDCLKEIHGGSGSSFGGEGIAIEILSALNRSFETVRRIYYESIDALNHDINEAQRIKSKNEDTLRKVIELERECERQIQNAEAASREAEASANSHYAALKEASFSPSSFPDDEEGRERARSEERRIQERRNAILKDVELDERRMRDCQNQEAIARRRLEGLNRKEAEIKEANLTLGRLLTELSHRRSEMDASYQSYELALKGYEAKLGLLRREYQRLEKRLAAIKEKAETGKELLHSLSYALSKASLREREWRRDEDRRIELLSPSTLSEMAYRLDEERIGQSKAGEIFEESLLRQGQLMDDEITRKSLKDGKSTLLLAQEASANFAIMKDGLLEAADLATEYLSLY